MCATRAQASGSCSRTQRSFGAVNPVRASLPVISIRRCRPTVARIASHSAAVRWSFHRIAGRMTSPAASSSTAPCIWPVSPMPSIPAGSWSARSSTCRIAATVPSHHSAGSCSLHSGRGWLNPYSAAALAMTTPCSSTSRALVAVVETSMPRTTPIGSGPGRAVDRPDPLVDEVLEPLLAARTPAAGRSRPRRPSPRATRATRSRRGSPHPAVRSSPRSGPRPRGSASPARPCRPRRAAPGRACRCRRCGRGTGRSGGCSGGAAWRRS